MAAFWKLANKGKGAIALNISYNDTNGQHETIQVPCLPRRVADHRSMSRTSRKPGRATCIAPTQKDYERLAQFRHALRCFMAFSEDAARAAGLTPKQHQALLAIKGTPAGADVTVGDLANQLLVRHNSAVELVNRLELNGLLVRHHDGRDARRALLALTPKGETALLELSAAHLEELRRAGPEISSILMEFVPAVGPHT